MSSCNIAGIQFRRGQWYQQRPHSRCRLKRLAKLQLDLAIGIAKPAAIATLESPASIIDDVYMTLREVLQDTASRTSQTRINEAQTVQVMVLRILQALGWDIWNSTEVFPQKNNAGNRPGGFIPDLLLHLNQEAALIVEVKALGTTLSPADAQQCVNYAVNTGLRYAVLTDGQIWQLYDKQLTHSGRVPAECLLVTIEIGSDTSAEYLERLLSKLSWSMPNRDEYIHSEAISIARQIKERQSLDSIFSNLEQIITVDGAYNRNIAGLKKAIQTELDANDQQLALDNLETLAQRLGIPHRDEQNPVTPTASVQPTLTRGVSLGAMDALKKAFEELVPSSNGGVTVVFKNQPTSARSWADLLEATVNAFLSLHNDSTAINQHTTGFLVNTQLRRPAQNNRKLINDQYLYTNFTATASRRFVQILLRWMGIHPKSVVVTFKNKEYQLP